MTNRRTMVGAGAVALALLLPVHPVRAAPPPPASPAASAPSAAASKRATERVEHHIDDLHKRLGITPAQQAPWDAFAAVMRDNGRAMEQAYTGRPSRTDASAVDDMRAYAALARLHADSVGRLLPPFEALYATMSPDQRVTADKTFREFDRRSGRHAGP